MDARPKEQPSAPANIHVMPDEFYGGRDPVVHYKKQTIVIEDAPVQVTTTPKPPALPPPPLSSPAPMTKVPGNLSFWQKRKLWILSGAGLLLVTAGVTIYFLWQEGYIGRTPEQPLPPPPTFPIIPVVAPTTTDNTFETPTTTDSVPTTTVSVRDLPLDFPPTIFSDSADLDADSLTDMEEEVFGVDSGTYDTDLDGYYDGLEVFNLYNPKGTAPMKIIDSGLVQEYVNPVYRYRLYYPVGWNVAPVDPQSEQVLFSAITGDFVEVRAVPRKFGESFAQWFGRMAPGQQFTEVALSTNRFQVEVWHRADGAVVYIPADDYVFVLIYHPFAASAVPFRNIVRMMEQSFRPTKTIIDIPPQEPIPQAVTGTEDAALSDTFLPDETL